MTQQGRSQPGRPAPRTGEIHGGLGQVCLNPRQLSAQPRLEGAFQALAEFLQRQAAGEKMLAKRDDHLVAVGVRDAQGRIVRSRHANRIDAGAATVSTTFASRGSGIGVP